PVLTCYSGQACPESGYWKVIWPFGRTVMAKEVIRHFQQGETFPTQIVKRYVLRTWPMQDKTTLDEERVEWGLLG
ncbi:hypothetical protein CER19_24850, partial [Pseudomonas sp. GL93]